MEHAVSPLVDPVVLTKSPTQAEFVSLARLLLLLREDATLCNAILFRLDPRRLATLGLVLSVSAASGFAAVSSEWQLCGPYESMASVG